MKGIRRAHIVALVSYALLAIFMGITVNLGAAATAVVVLLPVAVIATLLVGAGRVSAGENNKFETAGVTTKAAILSAIYLQAVEETIKANVQDDARLELPHEDASTLPLPENSTT